MRVFSGAICSSLFKFFSFVGGTINRVFVSNKLLEIHFIGSDNVWLAARPHFPARPVFRVSWSERGFGRTFVSDTSTKCIDREDLGRRRQGIECFHSRGQHLCKYVRTKENVCIRKEFNSQRTGLGHQHGRRFIVLGHQYGRRDVM